MTDWELVREYARTKSDAAFSRLVERHLAFVYRVCRREVGDDQAAEDAALAVFLLLSQKAHTLRSGVQLTSWLFSTARLTAKNAARQEHRRKVREQMAQEFTPQSGRFGQSETPALVETHLNDALAALSEREREAVLLRYQDDLEVADVGRALGISEHAAQKRVSRGLEKMRRVFATHGAALGIATIASVLTAEKSQAAPAALLAKIKIAGAAGRALPALHPLNPLFAKGILLVSTTKLIAGGVAAVVLVLALTVVAVHKLHSAPSAPSAVTWLAPPASDSATQQAQQQIKADLDQWASGYISGNAQSEIAVLSPDFIATGAKLNGVPHTFTYREWVQVLPWVASLPYRSADLTVTSCSINGNTATVQVGGSMSAKGPGGGDGFNHGVTLTFANTGGKWLITSERYL